MSDFMSKDYKAFNMFASQWALVTAGSPDNFNSCTVAWGSMGNLWSAGKPRAVITVYVHPARYTSEFMLKNDTFTVSFYPESCKKALGYMGSHSGRDEDKVKNAGLTPMSIGDSVSFEQANTTFLCKKLYQHQFSTENLVPEIQEYYAGKPKTYPDGKGGWQPHIMFIGEVIECIEK